MEQTTELIKVDAFQSIIATAPSSLDRNQQSVSNAVAYGEKLAARIAQEGMNDAVDQECNNFLVKLKRTVSEMNERRKGITQIFDDVKKAFTSLEARLDSKSEIYQKIQKIRDDYAAEKIRKAQEAEKEARRKLAIENERTTVRAILEEGVAKHVSGFIAKAQRELLTLFEGATLENFDVVSNKIKAYPVLYPTDHFLTYDPIIQFIYITKDDAVQMLREISDDKYILLSDEYRNTITTLRDQYIDKLPSKRTELEAIAKANAEEAERLRQEAEKRSQEEADRQEREKRERDEKARIEAEANKQIATANNLFDAQVNTPATPPAQVREGFEIIVKNPLGYLAIVAFFFEKAGKTATVESLEKKTLGSMKSFCEAVAKSTGEVINNPYLEYKEVYKTVARK